MTLANECTGAPGGRLRSPPPRPRGRAFPRICRHRASGAMRENPRAESGCSHRRGEEEMERAIRIRPPLRVRSSAQAHASAARAKGSSRNGSAPADAGFRTRGLPRSCGARAPRRSGDGGSGLMPRLAREFLKISINSDKFTGFFDKKTDFFGDLSLAISMSYGFQGPFSRVFRGRKFQKLCKIQAGYFSTRRFAITIRWMSFVPSPTCRRMESR